MHSYNGDIWDLLPTHDIVIPVNNQGVMGRGLAHQAKGRFPLQCAVDIKLRKSNNGLLCTLYSPLIFFAVKQRWHEKADRELIMWSCTHLFELLNRSDVERPIALPQVGCGFGELDWQKDVEPIVREILGGCDEITLVQPTTDLPKKYPAAFRAGTRRDRLAK